MCCPSDSTTRVHDLASGLASRLALSLVVLVVVGVLARPTTVARESRKDLAQDLRVAYAAHDWTTAVEIARRVVALDAKEPGGWYNLACMQSRAGASREAMASLRESA